MTMFLKINLYYLSRRNNISIVIKEEAVVSPCSACFLPFYPCQVSSGFERAGFTFQGDIHGKDFGKFKLERQGKLHLRYLSKQISDWSLDD